MEPAMESALIGLKIVKGSSYEGEFFREFFPTGVENWFEFAGISNNRGFEKSGLKLQC